MTGNERYLFSHNDSQESANEVKARTKSGSSIDKKEFIKLIGEFAYREFIKAFGCFGETFKSGDVIYVRIKNIDYIFTK